MRLVHANTALTDMSAGVINHDCAPSATAQVKDPVTGKKKQYFPKLDNTRRESEGQNGIASSLDETQLPCTPHGVAVLGFVFFISSSSALHAYGKGPKN